MITILDRYIISKFLKTFFFTVLIFSMISVVIDFSDKVEEFLEEQIPIRDIIVDYYINWVIWINGLLFPMYSMIAVIFFTSRLAYNSEIISMLNAGVSFRRLLVSYLIGAGLIFSLHMIGNHYYIPLGNKIHYDFQHKYIWKESEKGKKQNVHFFITPDTKISVDYYRKQDSSMRDFRIERFENNELVYLLTAASCRWKGPPDRWELNDYQVRTFKGKKETFYQGKTRDTTFQISPQDFIEYTNQKEMMDTWELSAYIRDQRQRGGRNLKAYEVELYRRTAEPFTIIILTIIGMAVASRKVRGGMGFHLALGVAIGAIFIFLSKFSVTFSINQTLPSIIGVWIPNVVFFFVAIYLILRAQK